jgi:hypothetical protein
VCGKETDLISTKHIQNHGYATAKEFKEAFNMPYLKSDEMRRKQSNFMLENNPTKGVGHTEEAIKKMSENRKGKGVGITGKYKRTAKIRNKISKGVTKAHMEGRLDNETHGKGCYINSPKIYRKQVWVRSSWEKRIIEVFNIHPWIKTVKVEPIIIEYEFDGSIHRYIPDFMVIYQDDIKEIWEIKADYLLVTPKWKAKLKALNAYCKLNHMNARVINQEMLEDMEMQMGIRPWTLPFENTFNPKDKIYNLNGDL